MKQRVTAEIRDSGGKVDHMYMAHLHVHPTCHVCSYNIKRVKDASLLMQNK